MTGNTLVNDARIAGAITSGTAGIRLHPRSGSLATHWASAMAIREVFPACSHLNCSNRNISNIGTAQHQSFDDHVWQLEDAVLTCTAGITSNLASMVRPDHQDVLCRKQWRTGPWTSPEWTSSPRPQAPRPFRGDGGADFFPASIINMVVAHRQDLATGQQRLRHLRTRHLAGHTLPIVYVNWDCVTMYKPWVEANNQQANYNFNTATLICRTEWSQQGALRRNLWRQGFPTAHRFRAGTGRPHCDPWEHLPFRRTWRNCTNLRLLLNPPFTPAEINAKSVAAPTPLRRMLPTQLSATRLRPLHCNRVSACLRKVCAAPSMGPQRCNLRSQTSVTHRPHQLCWQYHRSSRICRAWNSLDGALRLCADRKALPDGQFHWLQQLLEETVRRNGTEPVFRSQSNALPVLGNGGPGATAVSGYCSTAPRSGNLNIAGRGAEADEPRFAVSSRLHPLKV